MPIARAELCEKHKPRVYKHECNECKKEELELKWERERIEEKLAESRAIYRPTQKEETNAADDSAVATEGE